MNKSQVVRKSNHWLSEYHCDERIDKKGAYIRIFAATVSVTFVLGHCLGCSFIQSVAAEPVDKEPIINVDKPYASSETEVSKAEAQNVIDVLQVMGKAYAHGDIAEYIKHLDNQCSVFDEHKNKMVIGKEAVIAALKEKFDKRSQKGAEHILSYTIIQPYVRVNGDTAVVTYRVIEEVADPRPRKLEGSMSDVFTKEKGQWMKIHQRAVWKRVK